MVNDRWVGPGHSDRNRRRHHAGVHALTSGGGRVHPVQRQDEQRRGDEVPELPDVIDHDPLAPPPFPLVLNILSIRSVIRKPLTMFVIEPKRAIAPSTRIRSGLSPPATRIAPTT